MTLLYHAGVRRVVGTVVASLVAALSLAAGADAQSTTRLAAQTVDSDAFDNYDFRSASVSSSNVDWPVTLLFYNNANVNSIKASLGYSGFGSTMYGRLKNTGSWIYDEDGGRKNGTCSFGNYTTHYRLYADPNNSDRNWSPSLGFYVLGTTHRDVNECGGGTTAFGWSESAEGTITTNARGLNPSWQVYDDNWNMNNWEGSRWEGNHFWNNGATASMLRMP